MKSIHTDVSIHSSKIRSCITGSRNTWLIGWVWHMDYASIHSNSSLQKKISQARFVVMELVLLCGQCGILTWRLILPSWKDDVDQCTSIDVDHENWLFKIFFWTLLIEHVGFEHSSRWSRGLIGPQDSPKYLIKFNVGLVWEIGRL